MDRNQEYIRQLQERNRMKKMMTEKSEDELMKEELERGFSTHFRGAHASKDINNPSKVASAKPQVKIHTKAPSNDLINRLLPPGVHGLDESPEQQRSLSRGRSGAEHKGNDQFFLSARSHESRDGSSTSRRSNRSRSGSRYHGVDTNESEIGDQDSNKLYPIKQDDHFFAEDPVAIRNPKAGPSSSEVPRTISREGNGRKKSIPANTAVMDLMQSSDLNELLLGHIKGLTAEQKVAMIQLLQHTNNSSTNYPIEDSDPISTHLKNETDSEKDESTFEELLPSHHGDREHERDFTNNAAIIKPLSANPLNAQCRQDDRGITSTGVELNVKIKVYSTWTNGKNVILQGIRLRYNLEKGHLDVLHMLRPRIQSGLAILQQSTEAIRSLPILIGQAARFNGTMWKAPISSESPIELTFEGSLPDNAVMVIRSDAKPFDKANFELMIWNGCTGEMHGNSSAAKDVDIFVDNKCIWSGELPEENQTVELSRSIDKPTVASKFEAQPSSKFKLQVAPRLGSALGVGKPDSSINTSGSPSRKGIQPSPVRNLIKFTIAASPARSLNSNSDLPSKAMEDPSVPEWLRGSKVVDRKNAILESPMRTSRKEENDSEKNEEEFGAFNSHGKNSPVANRSAAKSRRRRPRDAAAESAIPNDGGRISSPGKNKPSIQYSSGLDRQDSDSNLRKSMEAVQHAEKFNLNRLESTLSKRRPRRNENSTADNMYEDSLDASQGGDLLQVATIVKTPPKSLDSMVARGSDVSSFDESNIIEVSRTLDFETSYTSKQATTSAKIDDVNAKLNNALTDLAEIMASLPRNRSEKKIRPVPFVANPISMDGRVVESEELTTSSAKSIPTLAENNPKTPVNINEMPSGKILRLQIFSTHGDMNYVGLNGIEIYDANGELLKLGKEIFSITAQPSDLGALPGYEDDPRKVVNLLDGVNTTKDDLHQWLAPHMSVAKEHHPSLKSFMFPDNDEEPLATITIQFSVVQAISMIRIYNFNKSRTHNQRGVKNCRFFLDNTVIFEGDIKRASGQMKISEADSQLIVFTKDSKIIEHAPSPYEKSKAEDDTALDESMSSPNARPKTAIKNSVATEQTSSKGTFAVEESTRSESPTSSFLNEVLNEVENIDKFVNQTVTNPKNRTNVREGDSFNDFQDFSQRNNVNDLGGFSSSKVSADSVNGGTKQDDIVYFKSASSAALTNTVESSTVLSAATVLSITARSIRIEFDNSWGDRDYVGMSGIEVLGIDGKTIPIVGRYLSFDASSDMFGTSGSGDRKVDNVVNGINNTANDAFMWLAPVPFDKKKQFLEISFPTDKVIIGLKFWNYNGNFDATLRGARQCTIFFDDRPTLKYLLRPGPECDGIDFSQTLLFDQYFFDLEEQRRRIKALGNVPPAYMSPKLKQLYEVVTPPTGLLWKLTFFNNHGDEYYIGLDAIDLFDADNQIVNIARKGGHVAAVPHSVRDLSASESDPLNKDPRIPEKLFGKSLHKQTASKSCWLAPLARCMTDNEKEASVNRCLGMSKHTDPLEYRKKKKPSMLPKDNMVMVMFSYPVSIAAIRFYNYSKSVRRGAKDFAIHVDGKLVFLGTLQRADEELKSLPDARSIQRQTAGEECRSMGQAVVFSHDVKVMNAHKDYISPVGLQDQDVLCINERQVMVRSKTMYEPPNTSAIVLENPTVDFFKRPTTSFFS